MRWTRRKTRRCTTPRHRAFRPWHTCDLHPAFDLQNGDCRVQVFMEADAEVELENDDGYTPMCVAASTDDPNCAGVVIHLVEYGADICKKCNGTLPYDLAVNKIVKDVRPSHLQRCQHLSVFVDHRTEQRHAGRGRRNLLNA